VAWSGSAAGAGRTLGCHARFHSPGIRKSQREGLVVRLAQSEEELRAFFEMHLKVRNISMACSRNLTVSFRISGGILWKRSMGFFC